MISHMTPFYYFVVLSSFLTSDVFSHQHNGSCCGQKVVQHASKDGIIKVEDSYYSYLKGNGSGAAYAVIHAQEEDELIRVDPITQGIGRVELHTHLYEDGVAKMRSVEKFSLSKNEAFVLKPGGFHIMLMDLDTKSFGALKTVELRLVFKSGRKIVVHFNKKDHAEGDQPCCH